MYRTARGGASGWRVLPTLALFALLGLVLAAPALAASGPFNGGPLAAECPTVIANDHTVYALRFTAVAAGTAPLAASTTYFMKIRFTPNADGSPAGTDNRGFTWRAPATMSPTDPGGWVQERADWTQFPVVTTGADGSITAGSNAWYFFKFGDTAKTGTYRILVSLSTGSSGTTRNADTTIEVQVVNAATGMYLVHDGSATNASGKRVELVDHATLAPPRALQRTEPNGCDDDGDGVIDNEQYGMTASGSFRLAAPVGRSIDALLQGKLWPTASTGFSNATPDVDIALGAVDQTSPSAPATITATNVDGAVSLTWGAASDNQAVTSYKVYRWTDAPAGDGYSPAMMLVHTVTGPTSWTDASVTLGTAYHYIVRAEDAATNCGPRSPQADVTPMAASILELLPSATVVKWGASATLTGTLTSTASFAAGQQVWVETSPDGSAWTRAQTATVASSTTALTYVMHVQPTAATYYRLAYLGDANHLGVTGSPAKVTPKVKIGAPVAPDAVGRARSFTVYGSLFPRHPAGSTSVSVRCYLRSKGAWVLKRNVKARNFNAGSATRYKTTVALRTKGSWKLVASYAATSKYAATTSGAKLVRVR